MPPFWDIGRASLMSLFLRLQRLIRPTNERSFEKNKQANFTIWPSLETHPLKINIATNLSKHLECLTEN